MHYLTAGFTPCAVNSQLLGEYGHLDKPFLPNMQTTPRTQDVGETQINTHTHTSLTSCSFYAGVIIN